MTDKKIVQAIKNWLKDRDDDWEIYLGKKFYNAKQLIKALDDKKVRRQVVEEIELLTLDLLARRK